MMKMLVLKLWTSLLVHMYPGKDPACQSWVWSNGTFYNVKHCVPIATFLLVPKDGVLEAPQVDSDRTRLYVLFTYERIKSIKSLQEFSCW
ncbi:2-oxoglutarate-dependent dioxygenase [Quillaja saponaria]|uniref:2-oxoglutarate-dependent dioxygenase n=1 Tax=Quillaja saponaria TaxID=32244 RepID=A0AAD7P6I9_QUISA|nr:2-oxoglutarate-dependent dioxygenase [Quillaja saponaria]